MYRKEKMIFAAIFIAYCAVWLGIAYYTGPRYSYAGIVAQTPTLIPDEDPIKRLRYTVTVDYDLPIELALREVRLTPAGKFFNLTNVGEKPLFFEKSEKTGRQKKTIEVVFFEKHGIHETDVFEAFDERGLRSADIRELLAFVAQCPRENALDGRHVVALGTIWVENNVFCNISVEYRHYGDYYGDGRKVDEVILRQSGGRNGFIQECGFLAVKDG